MQILLWTISFVLAAAAGYGVYRADVKRGTPHPWLTATLRGIVMLLALLLILAPAITITKNETQKPVILFLQDNSASIATALGKDSTNYNKAAQQLADKLGDKYKVVTWGFGMDVQTDSAFRYTQQSTDIANALSKAQEYYGAQNLGAVILASDGRYNQGSNPLYQQLSLQSPLYTVGIGDSARQKDLRITQVYSNKTATLNSQFEIRADVLATLCNGYNNSLQLLEGGNVIATSNIAVNSDRYDRSISFSVKADKAGLHHYTIQAPVADGEKNTANNKKDVFVEVVEDKKDILIAAASPHPDINAIKEALQGLDGYKLTVRMAYELPSFRDYDVVILHQLPSMQMNNARDIASVKKPMWFIMGMQSNPGATQSLFSNYKLAMQMQPVDAYPAYNNAFSSFIVPQNLQAVLDKMPPLNVPVAKMEAIGGMDVLFNQRGGQLPLWAVHNTTTPLAITIGEGLWRWRIYEYKNFNTHNTIDECIRQTIAFLAANVNDKPFYVSLPKYVWSDQEAITLNAYLLNATSQQVNTPDVQLSIADANGKKQDFSFERAGSAYKLNTGIWAEGNYTCTARTVHNGTTHTAAGSFVVTHTPLEQMESGADYALLYGLSNKYNGSFVPASSMASLYDSISKNTSIKPVIQSDITAVPLVDWKWYFLLILIFAVAEWLLRKYWLAQ